MKFLKVIGAILSSFISIIFFACLIAFVAIMFTKNLFQEKTINNYLEAVDIFNIPAESVLEDSYQKDAKLKDVITNNLLEIGIPKDLTEQVINNQKVTKLLAKQLTEFSNYVVLNKEKPQLNKNDIYEIINVDLIEQYSHKQLTEIEKNTFEKEISKVVDEYNNSIPPREEILDDSEDIKYIQKGISYLYSNSFVIVFLVYFALIFLIIALLRWSMYKPFIWLGIPITATGSLFVLVYLFQKVVVNLITDANGTVELFIVRFIEQIFKDALLTGGILVAIGISMIIIFSSINKYINEKKI